MTWRKIILFTIGAATAVSVAATDIVSNPAPLPIFLRSGFSSVLEFEEEPTRVVLGDSQAFQVEKLDRSLVLRTLVAYATSNMFVYFKSSAPRLFILTASEDAEPTYFKRIETPKPILPPAASTGPSTEGSKPLAASPKVSQVLSALFDDKKDYLTVEVRLTSDSVGISRPNWDLVRLRHQASIQAPFKLWAERKEIQKDSSVRARFIFVKPNIPRDLVNALLIVPLEGQVTALSLPLVRGAK